MMTRQPGDERAESTRATLVRALASESRSALARVELAASELERSGLAPALVGRVSTIRTAVSELDSLLGKIGLLSDFDRVPDRTTVDFGRVARAVLRRLEPGVRARGVLLVWDGEALPGPSLAVRMPAPTVELLCLGLVRLVVGAVSREASVSTTDASSRVVRLEASQRGRDVCLVARCAADGASPRFDRAARLELEVVLAEWAGAFLVGDDPGCVEVGIALPASRPDAIGSDGSTSVAS